MLFVSYCKGSEEGAKGKRQKEGIKRIDPIIIYKVKMGFILFMTK
jgi:hypothetical protein